MLAICLIWTVLGTAYNDFNGGDHSGISRNVFCGALFSCTFGGALSISLGLEQMSYAAWQWTILVSMGIIACTIQTQDFGDETSDNARGRHTLVIEMGRTPALSTIVVTVSFWSLYTPLVFQETSFEQFPCLILTAGLILVMNSPHKVHVRKIDSNGANHIVMCKPWNVNAPAYFSLQLPTIGSLHWIGCIISV